MGIETRLGQSLLKSGLVFARRARGHHHALRPRLRYVPCHKLPSLFGTQEVHAPVRHLRDAGQSPLHRFGVHPLCNNAAATAKIDIHFHRIASLHSPAISATSSAAALSTGSVRRSLKVVTSWTSIAQMRISVGSFKPAWRPNARASRRLPSWLENVLRVFASPPAARRTMVPGADAPVCMASIRMAQIGR